jgi:DNA topoisomerase-1
MKEFYDPFSADLEQAPDKIAGIMDSIRNRLMDRLGIDKAPDCDECGNGPMILKFGRHGWFWACDGYPKCKGTRPVEELEVKGEEPEPVDVECPECGAGMVVKSGRFGRFLACSRYPECKGTRPLLIGVDCPDCGEPMAEKRSKRGRIFYGCTNYPKCKFASWDRPLPNNCPVCGYSMLVEKETKSHGRHFHCTQCKSIIDPDSL